MADAVVTADGKERFARILTPAATWRALNIDGDSGTEHLIAFLERGLVRLELVGVVDIDTWTTCYDVYVKTGAESEWVFYESIQKWCGEVFDGDLYSEMKAVLNAFLEENEWDPTHLHFPVKKGFPTVKSDALKGEMQWKN